MSLEELLAASSDETVRIPEGFMDRVENGYKSIKRRRTVRFISAAAALALIAGIGFSLVENEPEDTFDDPQLAYAELEKAFARISDGIGRGVAMAEDSQRIIERTTEVFN